MGLRVEREEKRQKNKDKKHFTTKFMKSTKDGRHEVTEIFVFTFLTN